MPDPYFVHPNRYLAVDEAVSVALDTLRTDSDANHLGAAFQFLRGAVAGMMNLEHMPPTSHKQVFPPQVSVMFELALRIDFGN